MTPMLISVKEVSVALGVSCWTVRNLVASGHLPSVSLPSTRHRGEGNRRILVAITDLEAFIQKHRGTTR
jgi:excisionase family DNA binding protein